MENDGGSKDYCIGKMAGGGGGGEKKVAKKKQGQKG